jgi:phosphatidate phosphatase PAH1
MLIFVAACASQIPPSTLPDWHAAAATGCQILPIAHGPAKFRHRGNRAAHRLGEPRHRGFDLVTSEQAVTQTIEGELGYMAVDKGLEDEDVEIFACEADVWHSLGATRSDGNGHVAITLDGTKRLPAGLHSLYLAVAGDGRGVGFVAYVAPAGAATFVTDVDGTLTSTENGIIKAVLFKSDLDDQPGAPAALRALANGMQPIYLTARPHAYIELTRRWLSMHGYPRGPILTSAHFARPGSGALDHKRHLLAYLAAVGIVPKIAIGNRATDVLAYEHIDHVFVKIPGYAEELAPLVARGQAVEFSSYADLPKLVTESSAPTSHTP